jgi:ferredoxin
MAIVFFSGHDQIEKTVPDGTPLQHVIDAAGADIPFGCREGSCATCMIEVLAGMEFLNAPTDAEQTTLMPDELEQNVRLACQCRVSGGRVEIQKFEADF